MLSRAGTTGGSPGGVEASLSVPRSRSRYEGVSPLKPPRYTPVTCLPASKFCMLVVKSRMLRFTHLEASPRRRWHALVVLLAMCALTVSVATRYCSPRNSSVSAIKTLHQHSSPETARQRLTKDAADWMPPFIHSVLFQAPASYPPIAHDGPPTLTLVFEKSLYNRPPPRSTSLA